MIDVIEVNPADGEIAELFDGGSAFDMKKHGRLWFESKRHKSAKAAGLILKLAQLAQMIDPLLERLDVSIKHRASAAATQPMPNAMDIKPLGGGLLAAADFVALIGVEHFLD